MLPEVGSSMQLRQRKNVDFPDPDGPITTTFSPFSMVVLMFSAPGESQSFY